MIFEFDDGTIKHRTKETLDKIKEIYKVDVSDIEDLNLSKVLQRIRILKNI